VTRRPGEPDEGAQVPGGKAAERLRDQMLGRLPQPENQDADDETQPGEGASTDGPEPGGGAESTKTGGGDT
jgi:hypothetical protein